MDRETRLHLLSHVKAFSGLSEPDLEGLVEICEEIAFQRDETLIKEDQPDSAFYILVDGHLKVLLQGATDSEEEHRATDVQLNQLKPGDFFGEYSLIDGLPASASIVAVEPGWLMRISKENFEAYLATNDRIARTVYLNLLKLLVRRLREREDEYDQVLVVG
jgi:CRP/FNR family transcriptional regulator/CRP/FNR family cyclic AMP-dependent transcriptional regulator